MFARVTSVGRRPVGRRPLRVDRGERVGAGRQERLEVVVWTFVRLLRRGPVPRWHRCRPRVPGPGPPAPPGPLPGGHRRAGMVPRPPPRSLGCRCPRRGFRDPRASRRRPGRHVRHACLRPPRQACRGHRSPQVAPPVLRGGNMSTLYGRVGCLQRKPRPTSSVAIGVGCHRARRSLPAVATYTGKLHTGVIYAGRPCHRAWWARGTGVAGGTRSRSRVPVRS